MHLIKATPAIEAVERVYRLLSQVHSQQAEQAEFVRKMQQVSLVLLSLYKDVEALISEKPVCQSQDAQELMSQIA